MTQISPMLAVRNGVAAIDFYKRAFDAEELWRIGDDHIVAGLSIYGAQLFLASESPEHGTRSPDTDSYTTVRIELFVDDPHEVQQRAIEAGAIEKDPVGQRNYPTSGPKPIKRMIQGRIVDP